MAAQVPGAISALRPASGRRLIFWSEQGLAAGPVADLLRPGRSLDVRTDIPAADAVGGGEDAPEVILLCRAPVDSLCRTMLHDVAPSVALDIWRRQARAILALSRRNRRKVRILFAAAVARDPKMFLRLHGLPEADASVTLLSGLAEPVPDGFLRMLAERSLLGDVEVRSLVSEMMALSPDLSGEDGMRGDPDAVFQGRLEHRAQLETLSGERAKALEEAGRLQLDLEARDREKAATEAQLETLSGERAKALEEAGRLQLDLEARDREKAATEAELQEARRSQDRLRRENDLLRNQQQVMHEQMEALYAEKLQAEQRAEQTSGGLDSYRAQVEVLQSQLDGAQARLATREKVLAATGAMLRDMEALAVRQEDRRAREADRCRIAEAETGRLETNLAQEAGRRGAAEAETRRLETDLAQEADRRRAAEAEVARFLNSRSYRLAAPLRWIRSALTGGGRT